MCGIIGILHARQAAEEIFLGLQNLQHRGQDGGGIVTLDEDGGFHQHRGTGLLEAAIAPQDFQALCGNIGIGHTRYTTTGKQDPAMLQPFMDIPCGLAIAHNGNLVNFHQEKRRVRETDPTALATGCDSELILYTLSENLRARGKTLAGLLHSVTTVSETLAGSYSVVGILDTLGLFAFRDPYGLRPLVLGRRLETDGRTTYAVASESLPLSFLGFTGIEDIQPGELVVIAHDGTITRQPYALSTPRHCMFEWVYFARVESELDRVSVYQARFQLGVALAKTVRENGLLPDIVVPVPETSRIAAIALAEQLGVPFREVLIKNRYVNRTFILESQAARQEALRRKLFPVAQELVGKKVLIVDDSIVRGNTAIQIVDLLRKSGAKEIYLASTCPPIQHPCYYGIDFPDQDELMAGSHPLAELPAVLGVDALVYQTLAGLQKALRPNPLCMACLTGDYPTDISSGEEFRKHRSRDRALVP